MPIRHHIRSTWDPQAAARVLTIEHNDQYLACRDNEKEAICQGIEVSASQVDREGHIIYVFGQPGTGKTATVRAAWKELAPLGRFQFHEINALGLQSPSGIFLALHKTLLGKSAPSSGRAFATLNALFQSGGLRGRLHHVVLIDEFDNLIGWSGSKFHDRLFTLFAWPSMPKARLTLLCVANTLCLPHHLLPRCFSRLGLGQIRFGPYTHEQLIQIVEKRLAHQTKALDEIIDPAGLELLCRRVAALAGDARKVLKLASNLILQANGERITIEAVKEATASLYASTTARYVALLPLSIQTLLLSLAAIVVAQGSAAAELGPVCPGLQLYERFCAEAERMRMAAIQTYPKAFARALGAAIDSGLVAVMPHVPQRAKPTACRTPTRPRQGISKMEMDPSSRGAWGMMAVVLIVPAAELVAGIRRSSINQEMLSPIIQRIETFE